MNTGKAIINRLATGVPGLDEVLGGGLPEYSFNVIAGSPGSGKTTLAHQMMFAMATPERPALYFTVVGEPPLKMLRYQQQFEFFDTEKIDRAVRFMDLTDEAASQNFDRVLSRIADAMKAHGPALVFVDSFRSLVRFVPGKGSPFNKLQQFIPQLGMLMTSWQATTFLIGEYISENEPNPVFTVADGLIWLRQSVQGNCVVRKMEIMKMRGQPALPGLHTYSIDIAGIHVYGPPQLSVADEVRPASQARDRLRMGVPALDEMMGGGLPRGYSLLVVGPSGSGKTIMATAFLAEGARAGETGVIVAFEQRADRSRGRVIAHLIASDRIGVINTRGLTLSVDEIATRLISEIHRLKASRVVIDSLSGFELSLASTFRADFRQSLARMMSTIACTGVTVMMTSELEDRYDELRFSPYGTAFLTDSIIVQRYIEVDSRLLRVLAVVKLRASAHSNALHLFQIDDDGIKIGPMLADREGLLVGRPTRGSGDGNATEAADE